MRRNRFSTTPTQDEDSGERQFQSLPKKTCNGDWESIPVQTNNPGNASVNHLVLVHHVHTYTGVTYKVPVADEELPPLIIPLAADEKHRFSTTPAQDEDSRERQFQSLPKETCNGDGESIPGKIISYSTLKHILLPKTTIYFFSIWLSSRVHFTLPLSFLWVFFLHNFMFRCDNKN